MTENKPVTALDQAAWTAGYTCAQEGGKLKTNPCEGGSNEWWSWHKGYKDWKQIEASELRAQRRYGS